MCIAFFRNFKHTLTWFKFTTTGVQLLNSLLSKHFILQHSKVVTVSLLYGTWRLCWFTLIFQVASLLCLLVSFSLVLCESVLQHDLVLLQQRHAGLCVLSNVCLWNGTRQTSSLISFRLLLLKNNVKEAVLEFHLVVQFLHDLFKLGVWCPGRNTNCQLSTNLPQILLFWPNSDSTLCSIPAFLLQLILQLHLAVKLLLQLVDPFLQVLQLSRK